MHHLSQSFLCHQKSQQQDITSSNGVVVHEKSNGSSCQNNAEDECNGISTKHMVKETNHEVDNSNKQNLKGKKDKKTKKHKEREKSKDIDSCESEQKSKVKKHRKDIHGNAEESDKLVNIENKQKRKRSEEKEFRGEFLNCSSSDIIYLCS